MTYRELEDWLDYRENQLWDPIGADEKDCLRINGADDAASRGLVRLQIDTQFTSDDERHGTVQPAHG